MHSSPISSIAAHKKYIATSGYDNQIILWSKENKDFIARGVHDHLANKVVFSPDGNYILSASSDYTVRLWSVPEMRLKIVFDGHNDDVENICFSNNGQKIATASRDRKVRVFNVNGNLMHTLVGHSADALSVVWSKDDQQLISSGDDGTIRIWDVESGKEIQNFSFDEVETDTCSILNGYIYAGNDKGEIIIIKIHTGEIIKKIKAHESGIKSIVIHEGFKLLLSSSYDKKIILWNIDAISGNIIEEKIIDSNPMIWLRATVIVDQKLLAFGTFGTCYATYNLQTSEWNFSKVENTLGKNAILAVDGEIFSVGDAGIVYKSDTFYSEPGSLCNFLVNVYDKVYTGGQTGQLFDASTGKIVYEHRSPLNCGTVFHNDGQTFLVIGSYTGEGILFKFQDGNLNFIKNIEIHSNAIKGITSNSKYLFSVSANRDVAYYDLHTLKCIKYIHHGHTLIANGCDYQDEHRFVSISRDRVLRIWENFELSKEVNTPHTHSIKCIKAANNKRHLIATGSYNGLFCIYNLKTNEWVIIKRLTSSGISSLSYDEATNNFLASSYNGKIYYIQI